MYLIVWIMLQALLKELIYVYILLPVWCTVVLCMVKE